jgi:hypothetical protein
MQSEDEKFFLTLQKYAPRFVAKHQRCNVVYWISANWPLLILSPIACLFARISIGYPSPTWPFYVVEPLMIWWSGRISGAIMVVIAAVVEAPYLQTERWVIMVMTLSLMLILRGRRGLGS